jgi:hypothetical protein
MRCSTLVSLSCHAVVMVTWGTALAAKTSFWQAPKGTPTTREELENKGKRPEGWHVHLGGPNESAANATTMF